MRSRERAAAPRETASDRVESRPDPQHRIFGLFVDLTLDRVRHQAAASDRCRLLRRAAAFTGPQNGIAISGDYLSAASFLGIAGAIALNGYDGFLYSIGFLVAWLIALLLVAELLRNTGKYTMGDVLASGCASVRSARPPPPRRWPSRSSTCWPRWPAPVVSSPCCSASPARAARARHRRRRRPDDRLRPHRRHEGHHLGADHQGGAADRGRRDHDLLGAGRYGFNFSSLLGAAVERAGGGREAARAGLAYGKNGTTKLDFMSLAWRWCSAPRVCRTS